MAFTKRSLLVNAWGEWPSRLRRCDQNRKVLGSNPTRCSAGLRDPTSLRGSRWLSGRACKTQVINIGWVRLPPRQWPKSWPWTSQIVVEKNDGSVSILHKNLRTLAELFKVFKGLNPVIFAEAFPVRRQRKYTMGNY